MSLKAPVVYLIPEDTEQVAKAAFPKGNRYLRLRDTLGPLFANADFQTLFSSADRPAVDPARLALVTILQFTEHLSDEQAAEAVRGRLDWKYMLALPLTDPGFDPSVLSEFRTRLLAGQAAHVLLDPLLTQFREAGLLRARGRQRSDAPQVLAAIRTLNRLECVGTTLRHALNSLAVVAPAGLLGRSLPEWVERYGPRIENYRLPESKDERERYATLIGADGLRLLRALDADNAPRWLREIPAVQTLRRVWIQNYTWTATATLRWRTGAEIPPAKQFIGSLYDLEARYSQKRSTSGVGYKIQLTESCAEELPGLITNVETTPATTNADAGTATIHESLEARALLPSVHLADTGFIDAERLLDSAQRYQVDLVGPIRRDYLTARSAGPVAGRPPGGRAARALLGRFGAVEVSRVATDAIARRGELVPGASPHRAAGAPAAHAPGLAPPRAAVGPAVGDQEAVQGPSAAPAPDYDLLILTAPTSAGTGEGRYLLRARDGCQRAGCVPLGERDHPDEGEYRTLLAAVGELIERIGGGGRAVGRYRLRISSGRAGVVAYLTARSAGPVAGRPPGGRAARALLGRFGAVEVRLVATDAIARRWESSAARVGTEAPPGPE